MNLSDTLLEYILKHDTIEATKAGHLSFNGASALRTGASIYKQYEDIIPALAELHPDIAKEVYEFTLHPSKKERWCQKFFSTLRDKARQIHEEKQNEILAKHGAPPVHMLTLCVIPDEEKYGQASTFLIHEDKKKKIEAYTPMSEAALKRYIDKETFDQIASIPRLAYLGYKPFGKSKFYDERDNLRIRGLEKPPTYNTWQAPDIDITKGQIAYPPTIKEFLEYLFCGDQEQLEVIYWFFRQHLLGHKVHNILYLLGRQGVGKTALFERLLSTMLGSQNVRPVDFKKMVKSGFNAELENLHIAYNDESPMDKNTANMLKSLTNGSYLSSPKFRTPQMKKAIFSICILANPDEVVIPLVPNSRRNIVLKHPDIKMKTYFSTARAHEIWESLGNPEVVGQFARWILSRPTKYPDGAAEIDFKGSHYYESVLQSYRYAYEGELVSAFISAGVSGVVKTSNIKILNKKIHSEAIRVFLQQWEEAGFKIGHVKVEDGKTYFISDVSSRADFLKPTRKVEAEESSFIDSIDLDLL